jgi:hypothetical protein
MKSFVMHDKFSVRRLDRASKHVASLWFPINPEVLASIRKKLALGAYKEQPGNLFDDLKQDFALFTFIVKELVALASKQNVEVHILNNPAELISWAGHETIGGLLTDDSRLPLNHLLQSLSALQASRLRETAIVASTAEVLCANKNLNPQTGFSRGVIRETGLNLIAWNYPSLYSRIVKSLVRGQSLDEQLSQELGFSPVMLAMRVLHASEFENLSDERPPVDTTWENYDRLCEIGAALARADSPETYPSAENDWKLASEYLQKAVGNEGINLIRNKAAECSKEYKESLCGLFKSPRDLNPERSIHSFKKNSQCRRNRYMNQCAAEIQSALQQLYSHLCDAQSTGEALELLIRHIIPDAGFTGGCVYLVDPTAFALMPRTVFGRIKLRSVERVMLKQAFAEQQAGVFPGMAHIGLCEPDLAATALSCAQPVIERHDNLHTSGLTGMYASLGDSKKVGVLYLEAPESVDSQGEHRTMCTFKAMRQALADALKLD